MGATVFQGPHFHFNFLLNGVDVCDESHGKTALSLGPAAAPLFLRWEYLRDLVCVCVCMCALTRLGIEDIVPESKAKGGIASPLVIHLIK